MLLITSYMAFALFGISAARQVRQIRSNALHAALRQEMGWFDRSNPNEISSRIAGDTIIVEKGMGDKLGSMYVVFNAR